VIQASVGFEGGERILDAATTEQFPTMLENGRNLEGFQAEDILVGDCGMSVFFLDVQTFFLLWRRRIVGRVGII